jgi:hypothetical protein
MHTFQHRYHRNQEGKVLLTSRHAEKSGTPRCADNGYRSKRRRSSFRLKTERLLRAFRDKLASKVQASVFKYCAAPS